MRRTVDQRRGQVPVAQSETYLYYAVPVTIEPSRPPSCEIGEHQFAVPDHKNQSLPCTHNRPKSRLFAA
jgi:hypothetical protein